MADIQGADTSSYNTKVTNQLQTPFQAMQQVNQFQQSQQAVQNSQLELAQKRVSAVGQALIPLVLKDSQGNLNPAEIPAALDNLVRSNPGVFPPGFQQQALADFNPNNASQWIRGHAANNPVSAALMQHVQARPMQTNIGGSIVQNDSNPNTNANAANQTYTLGLSPEAATSPTTIQGANGQPSTMTRSQFPAVAGAPQPQPGVAAGIPSSQPSMQPQAQPNGPVPSYPDRQKRSSANGAVVAGNDPNVNQAPAGAASQARGSMTEPALTPGNPNALPGIAGPSASFAPGLDMLTKDKANSAAIIQGIQPLEQALPIIKQLAVRDVGPGSAEYSRLKSLAISMGIISPDAGNVSLREQANKYVGQFVAQNGLSGRSDLGLQAAKDGSPNLDLSLPALEKLTKRVIAIQRMNAATPIAFNGTPDAYPDHKAGFSQTQDPRAYEFDKLDPVDKQKIIANMKANPNSQETQRFMDSLRNAHNAGFLKNNQ